jgi:ABC-type polysaccharide/polyol phosphate transport system ATPase subunit
MKRKIYSQFNAVDNINLTVHQGDILGVIGRNGSGKSTLLKLVSRITIPTKGNIKARGNIVPLLELGGGFHKDLTGIENIYYYTMLLGYSKHETLKIIDQVADFAEIGEFIHQPISTYSSGMKSRLAFSVSVNVDPEILIIDEVLAVGDEYFKKKSLDKMHELFNSGKTILFVSHSAKDITELCTRSIMIHKGKIVKEGDPTDVINYYQEYFKK